MIRRYILTSILYNSGVTALLDFLMQCQEMYKDDVMSWGKSSGHSKKELFDLYTEMHVGIPVDILRNVRNYYVHDFDEEVGELMKWISITTYSDIACLCNYFGVVFDYDEIVKLYDSTLGYLETILEFKNNGGV